MTLHEYPAVEQRSDQWYALRAGIVTASTVGALLTPTLKVADNDTSRGLVASLVAERVTGRVEPSYMNDDMMRGVLHEPIARDRYAEHNGVDVVEVGFMVRESLDGTDRLGYSPDGLVGDDGVLEIKCPRAKTHIRTILADTVPAAHVAQCQAALLVSGREWLDFISFCGGLPLYVKRVTPDRAWHLAIEEAVVKFEDAAAQMVADYTQATEGLPLTERVIEPEMSL